MRENLGRMMAVFVLALGAGAAAAADANASRSAAPEEQVCESGFATAAIQRSGERLRERLLAGEFGDVEDDIERKLLRNRDGNHDDIALQREIEIAVDPDFPVEAMLIRWISVQPQSYVARLLAVNHYVLAAHATPASAPSGAKSTERKSGPRLEAAQSGEPPVEGLRDDAMRVAFENAWPHARVAMKLRPEQAEIFPALIDIAKALPGPRSATVTRMLREAQRARPFSSATHRAALLALTPWWGGNLATMDAVVVIAEQSQMPEAKKRHLRYLAQFQKGEHFEAVEKNNRQALRHYVAASEFCPAQQAHERATFLANHLEDWTLAVTLADRYLALRPDAMGMLAKRGYALESSGRLPQAMRDYAAAAAGGDGWSQNRLGYYYMVGFSVPRDLARARELLEAAAAQGNATARANLRLMAGIASAP